MSNRPADLFLADIRESIARIERYSAGLDRAGFEADEKTVDAVARNLEIIGEAARQLPEDFTRRNPRSNGVKSAASATALYMTTLAWIWKSSGKSSAQTSPP